MTKKKLTGIALAAMMAMSMAACGDSDSSTAATTTTTKGEDTKAEVNSDAAAAPGDEGFTEIPIDSIQDEEVGGFLNVSAVYFQAVPMSGGNEDISKFDIHLEADVSALENKVGIPKGDWVPYMTVDYKIDDAEGNEVTSGNFMTMSASDGPHYGANVALKDAGTYKLTLTFHSPEDNGYLVHTDDETGPGGTFDEIFGNGALTVSGDWDYVPIGE